MAFKFQGVDFIEFDSLLSENECFVRDTTRSFIEDNLIPIIEACNRDGRFPRELVKPRGELGFTSSRGKRPSRLHASMMGMRLSSIKERVVSRTKHSFSERSESNSMKSTPWNLNAILVSSLACYACATESRDQ